MLAQLLLGGLCGALYKGGALNTDFGSFVRANSQASLDRDAYKHAWTVSQYAPETSSRRLQAEYVDHSHKVVHIIYHAERGSIFEEGKLYAIRRYEQRLRELPLWRELCQNELRPGDPAPSSCNPGESFINYVWPEYEGEDSLDTPTGNIFGNRSLRISGRGLRTLPVQAALAGLRDEQDYFNRMERFFPKGFTVPDGNEMPFTDLMQSHFLWSLPIGPPGSGARYKTLRQAKNAFDEFIEEDLHPALIETDEGLEAHDVRVFYYSELLDRVDIFYALWGDCRLALGGMAVVLLIMRLHTASTPLALFGMFLVLESIPLGYVCFKQFSGLQNIGIINALSLFVIIGIGSDLVFVLTDGWRESGALPTHVLMGTGSPDVEEDSVAKHRRRMRKRLLWMWSKSGTSCITTTICAASSFLVNLGSSMMPLREFGLFMGLCVLWTAILQLCLYPMALVALEDWRRRWIPEDRYENTLALQGSGGHGSLDGIEKRSRLVRFFSGAWTNFVAGQRLKIICFFLLIGVVCVIGVSSTIDVDGSMPGIFPDDHNQVAGRRAKNSFEEMVDVASSSFHQDAWVCDITSPPEEESNCVDASSSCGSWASLGYCESRAELMSGYCPRTCGMCPFCLTRWCAMDEPPVPTQRSTGRCDCYEAAEDENEVADQSEDGVGQVRTTVVGFGIDSWNSLREHLSRQIEERIADPNFGGNQGYGPYRLAGSSVQASANPALIQQHWRSGQLSTWPTFEAPVFNLESDAVANLTRTVRQFCYCDGITPCRATGLHHTTFIHSDPEGWGSSGWGNTRNGVTAVDASSAVPAGDQRRLQGSASVPFSASPRLANPAPVVLAGPFMGRRLTPRLASVNIIWGLEVQELGPFELFVQTQEVQMWEFDRMFEPEDPWAQRSMLSMCEDMPDNLRAHPSGPQGTWLQAYENWLRTNRQEAFPSRNFRNTIQDFMNSQASYRDNFLMEDDGRVRAVRVDFELDVTSGVGLEIAMEVMKAWNDWVFAKNVAASIRAKNGWHTSSLWVRVEAQSSIINSTALTISISVFVGFLAAAIFTKDLWLAVLSMASITLIIMCLLFFMVTVMKWSLGAIEVVALIVFLGYMFTFNLHIVHSYRHAPEEKESTGNVGHGAYHDEGDDFDNMIPSVRKEESEATIEVPKLENFDEDIYAERIRRTRYALTAMGQSLMGSALTSVGCAVFLLFCTLQFFVKFGLVILLVTVLSLTYSLMFLPALLVVCGPIPGRKCSCRNRSRSRSRGAAADEKRHRSV
jgi:hypothetical protein